MSDQEACPLDRVLMFGIGGELFALDTGIVREILDPVPVTEVPGARAFVSGVINVRGKVVPLADLRVQFGMEVTPRTIDSRIIVVETELDGAPIAVGLLADKVYEVTEIAASSIEQAPRVGMRWRSEFVRSIGKCNDDFVIIPNIQQILT